MRCRPNSWKGFRVAVADDRTQDPGHLDTIRWLWRGYLRPQWKLIAVAFGLMMIEGGSVAVIAWMVGPMFDGVFIGADYAAAVWVGVVVFGAFLARASAGFGQRVAMAQVGQRAIARIQGDLVAHMMSLDNAWFQINPPGTLIERVRGDTQVMATIWAVGLSAAGRDLIMLFALLGVALARDWLLALVAMAAAPLLVLPVTLLQRWVRDVSQRAREAAARVSTRLDEIFHGVTTIKLNTSETRDSERLAREIDALRRAQVRSAAGQAAIPALMDLAAGIGFLGVLTYGGLQIIDGRMTVGELTSFLAATALLFEPLRRLGQVTGQWQAARASLDRLQAVFAERPTIQSPACPRPISDVARPPDIRFEDVHFAYADLPALDGLTFTAEAGQRTALVGASGAGKSTVFNLLSRLADPQRGQIRLGGVDIATLDLAALRGMFAVVSQDTALFDDPLRENIRFGRPEATEAAIREAVTAAHLDDVVDRLPAGLDSPAGPRGSNLSGGQRQRVAIARAVLRSAPVLLMDEPTSALDAESEAQVQAALDRLSAGRTTLVIAHRLSTVRGADRIIVLDGGRATDQGTHAELLARGGVYADLYRLQFSGTETASRP
jgi:subfamily B ATP-binding cassette protein MsbA